MKNMNKLIMISLILFSGCAIVRPSPESCMIAVRNNLTNVDYSQMSVRDHSLLDIGLYNICNQVDNDPVEAIKLIKADIR